MPVEANNPPIVPFLTTAQKMALTAAQGTWVFDTTESKYYYWTGVAWASVG